MKDATSPDELRERHWRRTDADALQRCGRENTADLELDLRLTEMLGKLPDAPLPSNFTARLLQMVAQEESRRPAARNSHWNWLRSLPRIAVATALVIFTGLMLWQHELVAHRAALVKNVAVVAGSQPLPSVDALKNFDAIQRMGQPRADEELLALMQ